MNWVLSFYAVAAFVAATALGLGIMLVRMLFGDEYKGYTPAEVEILKRLERVSRK